MEAGQFHALPGKAIQDRGPDPGVTVTGKIMVTEVVRHDEDDVGARFLTANKMRSGEEEGEEREENAVDLHGAVQGVKSG